MDWRKYRTFVLFLILTLLTTAFIFTNSLKSGSESLAQSNVVLKWVTAIIDPHHTVPYDTMSFYVRKAAHLTEFALLGFSLGGLNGALARLRQKSIPLLPLFASLVVAVADEFIQSFTGRTSQVSDVLIDFSGALLGLLVITIIQAVRNRKRRRYGR